MENIYVTKTLISNDHQSELDFDLYDHFGFSYEEYEKFVEIDKIEDYGAEAVPIKIDEMIRILTNLKEKGATHVQLESHSGHHGYNISGFEIRLSTEEEIHEYEVKEKERKAKEEKIRYLRGELEKLIQEL